MTDHLSPEHRALYERAKAVEADPWDIFPTNDVMRFIKTASPAAIIDILAQLGEARAVIAKLPKTADGVPIVPGAMLYSGGQSIDAYEVPEITYAENGAGFAMNPMAAYSWASNPWAWCLSFKRMEHP